MNMRMPVVFFGHGSPMVAIQSNPTSRSWGELSARLPRPRAILSISAHWETRGAAVTAMDRPQTLHDFGASFPKALFDMQYPAPGDPGLARRIAELLAPMPIALDTGQWGLDHGTWSVLVHAYPKADISVVQLSLDVTLSPEARFEIGRKLAPLRDEGVLIMGTGNIVHNLRAMNWGDIACAPYDWAARFNDEIRAAITENQPERAVAFANMQKEAPLAAPTPEHFWPLLYVLGARLSTDRVRLFNDRIEHGSLAMTSVLIEDAREAVSQAA